MSQPEKIEVVLPWASIALAICLSGSFAWASARVGVPAFVSGAAIAATILYIFGRKLLSEVDKLP